MAQLTFRWPSHKSFAAEDFVISSANTQAVGFLKHWPEKNGAKTVLLTGPQACGKTHLARIWAERHQAVFIDAAALGHADSSGLWQNAIHAVLEDIHDVQAQEALFHLVRHSETQERFLLLTSRQSPALLPFTLPDLRSRLVAMPGAAVQPPDEETLRAFLLKCFADRQLRIDPAVIGYMSTHMERTFAAAQALAEAIENTAASDRRGITIPLVKTLLF